MSLPPQICIDCFAKARNDSLYMSLRGVKNERRRNLLNLLQLRLFLRSLRMHAFGKSYSHLIFIKSLNILKCNYAITGH